MIELTGTNDEKALQLWGLLKNNSLTKEELLEIFTSVKDIIPNVLDCAKAELQNSKEAFQATIKFYETIALSLSEILRRNDSTTEERDKVISQLMELAKMVENQNENYQKQSRESINNLLWGFGFLGIIGLVIIGFKKKKLCHYLE